jgi:hypothetical protein
MNTINTAAVAAILTKFRPLGKMVGHSVEHVGAISKIDVFDDQRVCWGVFFV